VFEAAQDGFLAGAAARTLVVVQVHGYADDTLPGVDAVVSTGSTSASDVASAVGDRLAAAGLRICLAWASECAELEAFTNVQGQSARAAGAAFVHVELAHSVRTDDRLRAAAVAALVGGLTAE
jgi:hypothetical protein